MRLLLALVVCGWGYTAEAQSHPESYRLAFDLAVPTGWTVRHDVSGAALLVLGPRPEDGFRPNLNVSVEGVPRARPLAEAYRREVATLRDGLEAFKVIESAEATVGTLPARRVVYEHRYDGRLLRVLAYLVLADGRAYTLTGTATSRRFEASQPAFEQMVQSFRPG